MALHNSLQLVPNVFISAVKSVAEMERTVEICATLYIILLEVNTTITLATCDGTGMWAPASSLPLGIHVNKFIMWQSQVHSKRASFIIQNISRMYARSIFCVPL